MPTINGTQNDDILTGTAGDDIIGGLAGNDSISALDGNDIVYAGVGNDTIQGGGGNDTLQGYDGNDTIYGEAGDDHISGGLGADIVDGGAGNDTFSFRDDYPSGSELTAGDQVIGGEGFDRMVFSGSYTGQPFDITTASISGIEAITAEWTVRLTRDQLLSLTEFSGIFRIVGSGALDLTGSSFKGGSLMLDSGNDSVSLAGLTTGGGLIGNGGDDHLIGSEAANGLGGGDDNDILEGRGGNDDLDGGNGNDRLDGGAGADVLTGGAGLDIFVANGGNDEIVDFTDGEDKIDLSAYGFQTLGDVLSRAEQVDGAVVIHFSLTERLQIDGALLSSLTAADFVGISSSMTVTIPPLPEIWDGGTSGDDRYLVYEPSGDDPDTIDLGAGNDLVILKSSPAGGLTISNTESVLFDWGGPEVRSFGPITINDFDPASDFVGLESFAYAVLLGNGWPGNVSPFTYGLMRFVQVGDDAVLQVDYHGTGEFEDFITFTDTLVSDLQIANFFGNGWTIDTPGTGITRNGTAAGETIFGTIDHDIIDGGGGNDVIDGGYGNDQLTGGTGADIFVMGRNQYHIDPGSRPVITDFNPAEDQLDLRQYGYLYFADILSRAYQDGADVVIEFAPMERVTLQNVQLSSLEADNFVGILPGGSITALPPPETLEPTVTAPQIFDGPIDVAAGETIFGYFHGGLFYPQNLSTGLHQITNHGTIWATGYSAIYAITLTDSFGNSLPASIVNTGAIYATADGYSAAIRGGDLFSVNNSGIIAAVAWGGEAIALETSWSGTDLVNSGTISARGSTYDTVTSIAVSYYNGFSYDASIVNQASGSILVEAPSAIAIYLQSVGFEYADGPIKNHGLIQAISNSDYASIGIYVGAFVAGSFELLNTGTIEADIAVLLEGTIGNHFAAAAKITNDTGGEIIGDLVFGDRADSFINKGTFTGDLYADAGNDTVNTSAGQIVGYVDLGEGADQYVGGAHSDDAFGGAGNDTLSGGGGDDFIDGGLGADAMDGGAGNDSFQVDDAGDSIADASGLDTVYATLSYTLGSSVEDLVLLGWEALNGTGNALDNFLFGNAGNNLLSGGGGNDSLFGDSGVDVLTGGAGADRFYFDIHPATGVDQITDFGAGDAIYLNTHVFLGLTAGALSASAFVQGTAATTAAHRIVYDSATGNVYYDEDGTGSADAILFATVAAGTQLTEAGFTAYSTPPVTIFSPISYSLGADSLNLFLIGAAAINGVGNALGNLIVGNANSNKISGLDGSDELYGDAGADILSGGSGSDLLFGEAGADQLDGGSGDDFLDGGEGLDTASYASAAGSVSIDLRLSVSQVTVGAGRDFLVSIENLLGSAFDDTLIGTDSDNVLSGGAGNDVLTGGRGTDILDGGAGTDTASYFGYWSGVIVNLATATPQLLTAFDTQTLTSIENLIGSDWADTFTGNADSNFLLGGLGSDTLEGGAGDDVLNGGTAFIDGGETDTASYSGAASGVTVSLLGTNGIAQNTVGAGLDTLIAIESLTGSAFADQLTGSDSFNSLRGNGGDDHLSGLGGNDRLYGDAGADTIEGGLGDDEIDGGAGADTLAGGAGNDSYIIDDAGDMIVEAAGEGVESVTSWTSYTLGANVENLWLIDQVGVIQPQPLDGTGNASANQIYGNTRDNVLSGLGGDDYLSGWDGNDTLIGGAGNDTLLGGFGQMDAASYADALAGVTVSLAITAAQNTVSAGVDTLSGIEKLIGSAFDDKLTGSSMADYLEGGAGDDRLFGGVGNDSLTGGLGYDRMYGGAGDDTYYANDADDYAYEVAGEGRDQVIASLDHQLRVEVEDLVLTGGALIGKGNASDNGIAGNSNGNRLYGYGGNDSLNGGAGDDYLFGDAGNDTLTGGSGYDRMYGGIGDDRYIVGDATDYAYENAGEGTDRVVASINHTLRANVEQLELAGSADLRGWGNASANLLLGNSGNNLLYGRDGNDRLEGNAGNDILYGENGNDALEAGAGQDRYYGGAGADDFIFDDGDFAGMSSGTADRIHDFSQAQGDQVRLSAVDANSTLAGDQAFAFIGTGAFTGVAGQLRYQQISGNTYVQGDVNGDGVADFWIRLDGLHNLQASDFII